MLCVKEASWPLLSQISLKLNCTFNRIDWQRNEFFHYLSRIESLDKRHLFSLRNCDITPVAMQNFKIFSSRPGPRATRGGPAGELCAQTKILNPSLGDVWDIPFALEA
jgi:hypothetical protein